MEHAVSHIHKAQFLLSPHRSVSCQVSVTPVKETVAISVT